MVIVLQPDGFGSPLPLLWCGRSKREQVHDVHAAEAPRLGEPDTPADRRVVRRRVGRGRVQSNEYGDPATRLPHPPKSIAARLARAEDGPGVEVAHTHTLSP